MVWNAVFESGIMCFQGFCIWCQWEMWRTGILDYVGSFSMQREVEMDLMGVDWFVS